MNLKGGIIKRATAVALMSPAVPYKLGAVIFKSKRILSEGYNERRFRRKLHPHYKKFPDSCCAEKSAILSARCDLWGCSILVVRISRSGNLANARPCVTCQEYLSEIGVYDIYFSNAFGEIEYMRL